MPRTRRRALISGLMLAVTGAGAASAQPVNPSGYTFTTSPSSLYPDGGGELTDGVLGSGPWSPASFGPFAGWDHVDPSIQFVFASAVHLGQVRIGFRREERIAVYLPTHVKINSTVFSVAQDAIQDNDRGTLTFNGAWSVAAGGALDIAMTRRGQWTFADEVEFAGASTVTPEPVSMALLGTGLAGLAAAHRRRRKQAPEA